MGKKDLIEVENQNEMIQTCQYVRREMLKGFDALEKLKNSGTITDADLDYELARDRKAGLIFKSMVVEVMVDKINSRRISQNKE